LVVAAATLLAGAAGVAGTLAVASPAAAAEWCYNLQVTISIGTAGSYNGTTGNDVVLIKSTNGMTYYNPVDGRDHVCVTGSSPATVWAAGLGHWIGISNSAANVIYGSEGPDEISGGLGPDTIKGNGGNDRLFGYGGNDYIRGGDGDDQINGGSGDDCLVGGSGYNDIIGENGNDDILINKTDRYNASQCAPAEGDTSAAATAFLGSPGTGGGEIYPGNGNDRVFGSDSNDYTSEGSGSGNDILRGYGGNDSIEAGKGSDQLYGGSGNDILQDSYTDNVFDAAYGGSGTDSFSVRSQGGDVCYPDSGPATIACSGIPTPQG
jgi:Ca2+-binding RTX toxin-like protein